MHYTPLLSIVISRYSQRAQDRQGGQGSKAGMAFLCYLTIDGSGFFPVRLSDILFFLAFSSISFFLRSMMSMKNGKERKRIEQGDEMHAPARARAYAWEIGRAHV